MQENANELPSRRCEGGARCRRRAGASRDAGAPDPSRAEGIAKLPGSATSPHRAGLRSSGGKRRELRRAPALSRLTGERSRRPEPPLGPARRLGKSAQSPGPPPGSRLNQNHLGAGSAAEAPAAPAPAALPRGRPDPGDRRRGGGKLLCPRFSSSRAAGVGRRENLSPPRRKICTPSPIPGRTAAGLGAALPSTGAGAGGREPGGRGPSELPERERRHPEPGAGSGELTKGATAAPGGHPCARRAPPPPQQPESARRRQRLRPPPRGRRRAAGSEGGKGREREKRETAPIKINHHMTVAIRRRPPTAGAYAGEPGKSCEEGTHL